MITALVVSLAALFGLVFVGWRLASDRSAIPCPPWLSWLVELDNPLFRNNRASAIIAGLSVTPGMSALDLGCGPGRITLRLAEAVGPSGRLVAVDLQREMIRKAQARATTAGYANIQFHQGRIGAGELPEGPFDRAVLATVLGELPDKPAALREVFASLRSGGVLAITEVIADPHFQSRGTALALAQGAGFRLKQMTGGPLSYTLYLERP